MNHETNIESFGPTTVLSTFECAKLALEHIREWAKWMSGVQTAAIGGLSAIVMEHHTTLTLSQQIWIFGAFIFLSLALLFSAWTLSSTASLSLRLHSLGAGKEPSTNFDIFEQPSFTWWGGRSVNLGLLMGFQHWTWALGLVFFAVFFFIRFFHIV